ncbi:unnamed protein product [Moneuplotes crassus]|uniref:Uncharacterized protein n=1 Tax=Euplotes crassus TaxID=5936 RepID=A0AAD1Y6L6_EUPCR|nr:unnamed protein product [Moneuplotes crassus]
MGFYIERPKMLIIQCIVSFSHLCGKLPSVDPFQKQELLMCSPASDFFMIKHITVNLKFELNSCNFDTTSLDIKLVQFCASAALYSLSSKINLTTLSVISLTSSLIS